MRRNSRILLSMNARLRIQATHISIKRRMFFWGSKKKISSASTRGWGRRRRWRRFPKRDSSLIRTRVISRVSILSLHSKHGNVIYRSWKHKFFFQFALQSPTSKSSVDLSSNHHFWRFWNRSSGSEVLVTIHPLLESVKSNSFFVSTRASLMRPVGTAREFTVQMSFSGEVPCCLPLCRVLVYS